MTHPTPTLDIVALGEAMVEFNQRPHEQADDAPLYQQGFGGDTSNAAIAAARAGARVAYLTRLGTDRWGDRLMDLWQRENVNTTTVLRDTQAPTGMYFVSHDAQGHHFSYARAGSAASRMQSQDMTHWQDAIAHSQWLHLSGISLAISATACDTAFAAMAHARSVGTRVALDSNLRLSLWPLARAQACIRHAVSLCDLFLPSLEDMTALTGLTQAADIVAWSKTSNGCQAMRSRPSTPRVRATVLRATCWRVCRRVTTSGPPPLTPTQPPHCRCRASARSAPCPHARPC
jgi:2-dehydro-3-deoxygluconokinase